MGQQFRITLIATIGGFLAGLDTGAISKTQNYATFKSKFDLSNIQLGLLVTILLLGSMFGSLFSSKLADKYGRKHSIMLAALIFIFGLFVQIIGILSFELLCIGRLVTGVGLGILKAVVPMYLSEVTDPNQRGKLVSCQQLALTFGILIAFVTAMLLENIQLHCLVDWQVVTLCQLVPASFLFLGMSNLPKSPRWLINVGRNNEAKSSLSRLKERSFNAVQMEYLGLLEAFRKQSKGVDLPTIWIKYKKQIIIGVFIHIFQQISGINGLMYYSARIYGTMLPEYADTLAATQNILKFVATIPALFLVDRLGRRSLLLMGSAGCAISLVITATTMIMPNPQPVIAVVAIFSFVINFAYSLGPLPWVICSEIFPSNIRSKGMSICVTVNLTSNLLVSFLSPTLLAYLGPYTFYIFAINCSLLFIWTFLMMPETKNLSLEEIDAMLSKIK